MPTRWFCAVLLSSFFFAASALAADNDCSNASPAEAKALALKAVDQIKTLGQREAFKNFMDPDGEFFPRDLYVFVFDTDGLMLVNGAYPISIGTIAIDAEDSKGRRYIREMLRLAKQRGEGWVDYMWFNPCSGDYTNKHTFFKHIDGVIVAVGAYGSITAEATDTVAL